MRRHDTGTTGKIKSFTTNTGGNFAVLTAAAASILALAVGFAVDVAQLSNVRAGLLSALDAAVTSTARDLTTGKIKPEDARDRFEAFFLANAMSIWQIRDGLCSTSS